jgi:hypothetical protein
VGFVIFFLLSGLVLLRAVLDVVPRTSGQEATNASKPASQPNNKYTRNGGNTVVVTIVTLVAMPLLYYYTWYPALTHSVIMFSKDSVVRSFLPNHTQKS